MDAVKRARIGEIADHIRTSLELTVPVDVQVAVKRLRGEITTVHALDGDVDAQIEKTGNRSFRITVAESWPRRDLFSVAHELGHLFIHMGYLIDPAKWATIGTYKDSVRYRYGYTEEEYEANEFAGAFLMPTDKFRTVARESFNNGFYNVVAIAKAFGVSTKAARVRGQWLGLFNWT